MTKDEAIVLLKASGYIFEDTDEIGTPGSLWINLGDVWAWACSDAEEIPDEELIRVGNLFRAYGWPGLLYWVSCRHNNMCSEFADNNRFIDFVRHEEAIIKECPSSSQRAYLKKQYTLGES